ncbi:MAG: rRNA maturation RNase YbeY [Candidatus Liptonbacteria bacterium]|nr:rRNA maturation RNase YbeY [Candidatus Liptonbacteria bacterium]
MVEFKNLSGKRVQYGAYKKLYKKIFRKGKKGFELSVVFAPPSLMRKLNKECRGKDKTANVLSFALEKDSGEIFLNAGEKNLPYLFLHGSLHLLGYDHKKNKDAEKMENLEKKILNKK